jgi:hypothetical protein
VPVPGSIVIKNAQTTRSVVVPSPLEARKIGRDLFLQYSQSHARENRPNAFYLEKQLLTTSKDASGAGNCCLSQFGSDFMLGNDYSLTR